MGRNSGQPVYLSAMIYTKTIAISSLFVMKGYHDIIKYYHGWFTGRCKSYEIFIIIR